jgi:LEA14-like dessication related protein
MNSRMIKILLLFVTGILLIVMTTNRFFCSPPGKAPEFKEIKETKITNFDSDSISVTITAVAENKNEFDIDISDLYVNIIHETDTIGYANRKEKWKIGPYETGDIQLNSVFGTKRALKLISDDKDSLQLNLLGSAIADLGLFNLPVDVDLSFTVQVKEQIAKSVQQDTEDDKIINIVSAGIKKFGFGESEVEIDFEINNPYRIEFTVNEYPSVIFINGKEAGEGNIDTSITISMKGIKSNGVIKYKLSNTKTLSSVFGSLFSGKLEYEANGILQIDILGFNIQFPYKTKGVLVQI